MPTSPSTILTTLNLIIRTLLRAFHSSINTEGPSRKWKFISHKMNRNNKIIHQNRLRASRNWLVPLNLRRKWSFHLICHHKCLTQIKAKTSRDQESISTKSTIKITSRLQQLPRKKIAKVHRQEATFRTKINNNNKINNNFNR